MQSNAKINRHLQTGKRLIDPYDDAGEASALSRTNLSLLQNKSIQQNLQNSLSLLQAQDGALKVVGKILNRTSEIKSFFDSPTVNAAQKGMYNEEFRELQHELRDLAQSKWNGISLFSTNDAKTLFGPAVGTKDLMQESSNKGFGGELKLSRWGIYHVPPELDPPPPVKRKFLAMTLTDESEGGPAAYSPTATDSKRFTDDIAEWKAFTESAQIDAEIAVVVNQDSFGNPNRKVLPTGVADADIINYENDGLKANIYRGGGREDGTVTTLPTGGQSNDIDAQANFLLSAFEQHTDNGKNLPDALGVFVDNSGSLQFKLVNQGLYKFFDLIQSKYPSVILPSNSNSQLTAPNPNGDDDGDGVTNQIDGESLRYGSFAPTGSFRGIILAGAEDWVHQSKVAIDNLLTNDPNIANAMVPLTEEPTYELNNYDQSDFEGFIDTLSQARAQNGAEQRRVTGEIEELQTKQVGLERAMEAADGLDFSLAMTRYSRTRDQLHLTANLVSAAREMENVLYTDFLGD
jgi:flagellin-like hook-associated protein FlgL